MSCAAHNTPPPAPQPAPEHPERGAGPAFSQSLTTIGAKGRRLWLYPSVVIGRFVKARTAVAWALVVALVAAPWIDVGGNPAMFFDFPHRRFYFWGIRFFATDTSYLLFLLGIVVFSVFLFTAVFGRVWCGWVCPQTVFMESLIRPIERLIEGPPSQRKRRDARPLDLEKFVRKLLKHSAFLVLAGMIATTLVAYFLGRDGVMRAQLHPGEHPVGTTFFVVITGILMFDFSWFREQTCVVVCPYGRFQSVLMDADSLTILYDHGRGEPRGKPAKLARAAREAREARPLPSPEAIAALEPHVPGPVELAGGEPREGEAGAPLGDCIDCGKCVQVCPTGIDIRDGIQLECVNCTACIDACDDIMDRVGRPRGLIRYSTENMLAGKPRRILRPRVVAYSLALLGVMVGFGTAVSRRHPTEAAVNRSVGAPFVVLPDGRIQNMLELRLANKTGEPLTFAVSVVPPEGADEPTAELVTPLGPFVVAGGEVRKFPLLLRLPGEAARVRHVTLRVAAPDGFVEDLQTSFLSPEAKR